MAFRVGREFVEVEVLPKVLDNGMTTIVILLLM
jgi:hypothetical protein